MKGTKEVISSIDFNPVNVKGAVPATLLCKWPKLATNHKNASQGPMCTAIPPDFAILHPIFGIYRSKNRMFILFVLLLLIFFCFHFPLLVFLLVVVVVLLLLVVTYDSKDQLSCHELVNNVWNEV